MYELLYFQRTGMTSRQAKRLVEINNAVVVENEMNRTARRCTVRILKIKPEGSGKCDWKLA